jgi:rRNA maturation endonuclease Nob1
MKLKTVRPKDFSGLNMSLAQLFGSGPKFTIQCGNCSIWFKQRISMVDQPAAKCPYCGAINLLPLELE